MKFTQVKKYVTLHNAGIITITDILSKDDFLIHGITQAGTLSLTTTGLLTYTTPMGTPYRINDLSVISRILTRQEVNTDALDDIDDYIHSNNCHCNHCHNHCHCNKDDNSCNKPGINDKPSLDIGDDSESDVVYDTYDMFYNLQKYVNNDYNITDDMHIQDVDLGVKLELVANLL